MWEYILIGVLVLGILLIAIYHRNLEGFVNYDLPYGLLTDKYNLPNSYDDKVIENVVTSYTNYNPEVARAFQERVYQGNQLPLRSDERITQFEKRPIVDFAGKLCKPSCCLGKLPSDESCSHGCVCN